MTRGIFKYKGCDKWYIRYAGPDGKEIREKTGSKRMVDAQALLAKRKTEVNEGKFTPAVKISNFTFKELADRYEAWMNGRQRSACVKKYIIKQLVETFGHYPLRKFNTSIVDQLQTDHLARGLKNASCNKILNVLKHMFSKAVEFEMVEEEVLKRIRKVKALRENKRLRFLSWCEAQALIDVCDDHLRPVIVTALNTGMRKGEILSLTWDRVDLKHGFIFLDVTKNGERREVPINQTLRDAISALMRARRLDIPFVFYDPGSGKRYLDHKKSFHTALKKAEWEKCSKCSYERGKGKSKELGECPQCGSDMMVHKGITEFHFHDLRHTFASHLVMAGVDLTTVSRLLGHKDIKMTLRYSHLAPHHVKKAVEVLDRALAEKTERKFLATVELP